MPDNGHRFVLTLGIGSDMYQYIAYSQTGTLPELQPITKVEGGKILVPINLGQCQSDDVRVILRINGKPTDGYVVKKLMLLWNDVWGFIVNLPSDKPVAIS